MTDTPTDREAVEHLVERMRVAYGGDLSRDCTAALRYLLSAKEAAEAENAALRDERDAARDAVNRLGRAMGVVPGVAQCFGDVIDEAIKRLSARALANKGEG